MKRENYFLLKKFILIAFIFVAALIYLHQKVLCFVEAYKLSNNYQLLNSLIDKRDFLVYNFTKEVSFPKINQWVEAHEFSFAEKEKIVALDLRRREPAAATAKLASLFNRLKGVATLPPQALAEAEE